VRIRIGRWTAATAVVAVIFYVLALRPEVYEAASPLWLSWHVVLRKSESIGAFFIVALLFRQALAEHGSTRFTVRCILATAAYSALIEVGQYLAGTREGLGWNAFDTLCGGVGGALASLARRSAL
jgi:hypothetical protein